MSFLRPVKFQPNRLEAVASDAWSEYVLLVLRQHRHYFGDHLCLRKLRAVISLYVDHHLPRSVREDFFHRGSKLVKKDVWGGPDDLITPDLFVPFMFVFYKTDMKQLEIPGLVRHNDRVTVLDLLYNHGTPHGHALEAIRIKMFDRPELSIEESYLMKRVLRGFMSLRSLVLWKPAQLSSGQRPALRELSAKSAQLLLRHSSVPPVTPPHKSHSITIMSGSSTPLTSELLISLMKDNSENQMTALRENIKIEVDKVVTKLSEKQDLLERKQLTLESDQTALKSRVLSIESQLLKMKPTEPLLLKSLPSSVSGSPTDIPSSDNRNEAIQSIILDAKKTIGFSPVSTEDIERLKSKHSTSSDSQAMKAAVIEFLKLEMKASNEYLHSISIERVFSPRQDSFNRIYAKFSDQQSVDHIWSLTKNLASDTKVFQWIPPEFYQRFRAIDEAAFHLRKGPEKYKTKIRFGTDDLLLMKKAKYGRWINETLISLPPVELSPKLPTPTQSPPQGRPRLESSKRPRSSPQSESKTNKHSKTDINEVVSVNSKITEKVSEIPQPKVSESVKASAGSTEKNKENPLNPASPPPPATAPSSDHGLFAASSCLTPKSSQNKDFTWTASGIPTFGGFKSSLN